jgi:hypothetical protein
MRNMDERQHRHCFYPRIFLSWLGLVPSPKNKTLFNIHLATKMASVVPSSLPATIPAAPAAPASPTTPAQASNDSIITRAELGLLNILISIQ